MIRYSIWTKCDDHARAHLITLWTHFLYSLPHSVFFSRCILMIRRTWQNASIYNVRTLFFIYTFWTGFFDQSIWSFHYPIFVLCNNSWRHVCILFFSFSSSSGVHCLVRLQQPKLYTISKWTPTTNGIVHNKTINWINRTYVVVYFLVSVSFVITERRLFCGWLSVLMLLKFV